MLWLALGLAAAHSVAAWHVYSHTPLSPPDRASHHAHSVPDACAVCVAVAGLGGPVGAAPAWQLPHATQPQPAPRPQLDRPQPPAPRPYAIRAPPSLLS